MSITYIHEPWPTEFRTRTDISIAWDKSDLWLSWLDDLNTKQLMMCRCLNPLEFTFEIPPVWDRPIPVTRDISTGASIVTYNTGEGRVVLTYADAKGQIVVRLQEGDREHHREVLKETTQINPALARRSNDLWIAWAGYTDHLLNTIYSTGEFVFLDESKTTYEDDGTNGTPSLATLDNDLVLAWAGTDREHKINAAYIGRSGEMIDKVTPNLGGFSGAWSGVSAAGYEDQFHIGWAATPDSGHNIITMSGPWDGSPKLLSNEMRSIHPPALQPPLIAWVDSSSDVIYIGRV